MQLIEKILATEQDSLRAVMACIDRGAKGIALVVDKQKRLVATLTDGDLRRAVLAGLSLDLPIAHLIEKLRSQNKPDPITLPQRQHKGNDYQRDENEGGKADSSGGRTGKSDRARCAG